MGLESALVKTLLASPAPGATDLGLEPKVHPAKGATANAQQRLLAIFEAQYEFVWRALRRLGVPAANVEDGAQRVFIILANKLDAIEAGREVSFLFGTARRVASDLRETERLERGRNDELQADVAGDSLEEPDALLERKRARELLDRVLDGLEPEQRAAFVLFELEGLRMVEIARILDVPLGTVASRLRRARELVLERSKLLEQEVRKARP